MALVPRTVPSVVAPNRQFMNLFAGPALWVWVGVEPWLCRGALHEAISECLCGIANLSPMSNVFRGDLMSELYFSVWLKHFV